MRLPQPATIVIACPHCGTRYQVPPETIGNTGRTVSCAHCGKSWLAESPAPEPEAENDRMFDPADEERLDRDFVSEERAAAAAIPPALRAVMPEGKVPPPEVMRSIAEIKAAIAPKPTLAPEAPHPAPAPPDKKLLKKADGRFNKRQREVAKTLPIARLRRLARLVAVSVLLLLVGAGYLFRTDIVRVVPAMAGIYSALGMGVNVVGLDFTNVTTLMSRQGKADLITVTATIFGVEARHMIVPPVVVTLSDDAGKPLYQWSVAPRVRDLEPGEVINFSAELAAPPAGATRVKLSFAGGTSRSETPIESPGEAPAESPSEAPTDSHTSPEAAAH